ncbi:MAG: PTS sugar transporter subunit IIC, partial [Cetobacterium sp.]
PWLIKGFGVAGGMMPAIGFALLLNIMFKKEYIIFFVLGFILATYLNLPVIAIAAIGFIIAIYDYQKSKSVDKIKGLSLTSSTEEDYSDGI